MVYLIPIVAIVGAYYLSYRKQELKFKEKTAGRGNEIDELKKTMDSLKKRIQVLESIAATEQELNSYTSSIDIDEDQPLTNSEQDSSKDRRRASE